ncbi:MAG TPA: UDP-N-acetylenolpyruvoylglucosamine reductase [Bacillus sp. (in: Bacteria)]|jgi:UDP-N-acetylmuramate dehydrogenase|uniref:UDP-N-acetylenolpyruvoylglucosamine reductase n=7 Tax=Bacillus cereus group TaxID=86661 RepID=A0A9X3FGY1_BACCE|nr:MULTISPECIES: UDP-N-acetylmuramate dehydrogenase [Bacillus]MCO4217157.1 UDP-N-acetylmuramate dehydrogenase [Bacillus sp. 10017]MCU7391184.1 UDP-N-acetylmuramate dehydrogenase [Bacillus sp. ST24]MEB4839549.1 UDP-N-acetylmuramate dehydrogenase [Paenibacillus jamilae]HCF54510.1 UDP-N-acetylenolpyruvoylglucosamine reductase [Bacillus sp. (in: firmicutes)]AHX19931.1 UDP-N-acetylenolpyruvoylglucosamine reductase [Bacillus bombysepticus str. Wang]
MEQLVNELIEADVGRVLVNEPLARYTTMKIGGPADILIVPKHVAGIEKTLQLVKQYKTKWTVIGRGSNLLVSDQGIEGVVIRLGEGLDHLEVEKHKVRVGSGYPLIKLSTLLSRQGLAGLEFASGIPGSVGGAVYMNAGAHKSDISSVLSKALILFEDGTIDWLTNKELEFSYRASVLQTKRPGIVLEAVFQLQAGKREEIVRSMQNNKDYRRETQPWNHPCAGSVFRNPIPHFAGDLVEKAGLRGYRIGGAQISEMHGNFIVNTGGASAQDVLSLIELIKHTIKDKFDVDMHTEVEIIGR